jgi:RNA polymerase sigma-70 factor (ECF subfamily)
VFPAFADELTLHERVLSGDPVAPVDVFEGFMDPLLAVLRMDLGCEGDLAYDSAVDAVYAYLSEPDRYDRTAGRLCTYLTRIAKNKAIDRLRSATSSAARDTAFANSVELERSNPKVIMEDAVQARELWDRIESSVTDARDRAALKLIFEGESATDKLAAVLGLDALQPDVQRRQVKRERDRLIKALERLGKKLTDEQP